MKKVLALSLFFSTLCTLAKPIVSRANSDAISLLSVPLAQSHRLQGDYPSIVHQQHVNRSIQRALFTQGQPLLSNAKLLGFLQSRIDKLSDVLRPKPDVHSTNLNIQAEDVGYYGPIEMGTPPKTFQLLVDSGSADLWVGAEDCQCDDGGDCGPHNFLGPRSSSTFHETDDSWVLWYGTGAVGGNLIRDDISISDLSISQHKFGVAHNESRDFTGRNIPFDGICGTAGSKASRQNTITLPEALKEAGHISHTIVSYKIPRLEDNKQDGEMTLGGMNPQKYDSSHMAILDNINERGFWEVPFDDVKIDGKSLRWNTRSACIDTGSTLILAPRADTDTIHKHIPNSRFDGDAWVVPCNTTVSVVLAIGGKDFAINPLDIAWIPLNDQGECLSGISQGGVASEGPEVWLLGDVFLKNAYFSTDLDKNEVTLARLK